LYSSVDTSLFIADPVPESYWRELAEERRLSLAEALAENEKVITAQLTLGNSI